MKDVFLFLLTLIFAVRSLPQKMPPINWQLMDWKQDGYHGMSVEKAYNELLKDKKPLKKIVIAVMDCGVDTAHPDLAGIWWTNKKEIPGNGIDDDRNGFVDDVHGWNFGGNSTHGTMESVREYVRLRSRYESLKDTTALVEDEGYRYWKKVLTQKEKERSELVENSKAVIEHNDPAYWRKKELGDDPYKKDNMPYGNNNIYIKTPGEFHATGIIGVICALRNNGIGGNGITNAVEIMPIVHTWGDEEWDKDIAIGIRYAVDNGAQVINMSFGKYLSPQKEWVIDAMKYAEQYGVLIVAAAGNDFLNIDSNTLYPFAYSNDNIISNLIKVGASTSDSTLVASFSCYGKKTVDVFAPGVHVYTTLPNGKYFMVDGTSTSAPMVAGLAAFIWSYYPSFNYRQIKYCIEKSAEPINDLVKKPGSNERIPFNSLSRTGGIVNAFNAIKIAEQIEQGKIVINESNY
jgi:subtilisin family serine protease